MSQERENTQALPQRQLETAPGETTATAEAAPPAPPEAELPPGVSELAELLRQRDSQIQELQEQVKRLAADFENFRRRQQDDRQKYIDFLKEDLFRTLLPMVDHLERAAEAAHKGASVEAMVQGIDLVVRDIRKIFEQHGVQPIDALGQPFDPKLHEAMMTEERQDVPDETIVEELQKGYKMGERVLRPSRVKVARHPA
ncbi:MAG TPA: nucleotide exchange factor GrpE [Candidatus Nitrosotenuis sp.]|nr:nucleotide exchange factor GrpE [Candidatus Nitrosotenuis sp.]